MHVCIYWCVCIYWLNRSGFQSDTRALYKTCCPHPHGSHGMFPRNTAACWTVPGRPWRSTGRRACIAVPCRWSWARVGSRRHGGRDMKPPPTPWRTAGDVDGPGWGERDVRDGWKILVDLVDQGLVQSPISAKAPSLFMEIPQIVMILVAYCSIAIYNDHSW